MGRITCAKLIILFYLTPYVNADVPPGAIIGITFASFIGFCAMVIAGICCYMRTHSLATRRRRRTPTGNDARLSGVTTPTPLTIFDSSRPGDTPETTHVSTNGPSSLDDDELAPPPPYRSLAINAGYSVMDEHIPDEPPSYADISGGEIPRGIHNNVPSHEVLPPSYDAFVERQLSYFADSDVTNQNVNISEPDQRIGTMNRFEYVSSHSTNTASGTSEDVSHINLGVTAQPSVSVSPINNIDLNIGNLARSQEESIHRNIQEYSDFLRDISHVGDHLSAITSSVIYNTEIRDIIDSPQNSGALSNTNVCTSESDFIIPCSGTRTSGSVNSELSEFTSSLDDNEAVYSRTRLDIQGRFPSTDYLQDTHGIYLDSLEELGNQRLERFRTGVGPLVSGSLTYDSSIFDETSRADENILDTLEEIAQERHEQFSTTQHDQASTHNPAISDNIYVDSTWNRSSEDIDEQCRSPGTMVIRSEESSQSPRHEHSAEFTSTTLDMSRLEALIEAHATSTLPVSDTLNYQSETSGHEQFPTTLHDQASTHSPSISDSIYVDSTLIQHSEDIDERSRSQGTMVIRSEESSQSPRYENSTEFTSTTSDMSRLEALIEAHATRTLPVSDPVNYHSERSSSSSSTDDSVENVGSVQFDQGLLDTLPTYEEVVSTEWPCRSGYVD